MKLYRCLFAFAAIFSIFSAGIIAADEQDGTRFDEELNEKDFSALRDFLRERRAMENGDKSNQLILSGDLRTEWRHMDETCYGKRLRGGGAIDLKGRPTSRNDFDVEFNLYFNYKGERTWAGAQLRYDNSAGVDDNDHPCLRNPDDTAKGCRSKSIRCFGDRAGYHGSGSCDDVCLKKAYMGYSIYQDNSTNVDIELGRLGNLYSIFDSNIQFLSRLDGLVFEYDGSWECVSDWYLHAAGFLIDERVNHFGWVTEAGLLNIADSNIDIKYSFIDWKKNGKNRCFVHNPEGFQFRNSQFLIAYHLDEEYLTKPVKFFGAFLVNHAARKFDIYKPKTEKIKEHKAQPYGWYAGFLVGEVDKEGDWAFEAQYQYVQAQAMPEDDCGGICRGNILDEAFTTCSRRGNTNFKGWKFEALYAITDNLTIDTIIEWSKAANSKIGGRHKYSKLEVEAIYSF